MDDEMKTIVSTVLKDAGIKFSFNKEGDIIFAEKDKEKVVSALNEFVGDCK